MMDHDAPSCAICNNPAPPGSECSCEAERLEIAVRQAEQRAMDGRMAEIRDWVINHARTHVLQLFTNLSSARRAAHTAYLSSLPFYSIYIQYHGAPPLHPPALSQLKAQIADAHADFKRGVDLDWRASVLRYPEVLDYFYGLVELRLPSERSASVADPPFAQAGYKDGGFAGGGLRVKVDKSRAGTPGPPLQQQRQQQPAGMLRDERAGRRRREATVEMGYPGMGMGMGMGRPVKGPPVAPTPPMMPHGHGPMPGYHGPAFY